MRCLIRLLSFVSILHCFYACNPQPEAPALLAQAELFMESHPDSAMLLIDSIFAPEINLSNKQYMHYLVAKVRAKYKNHQNVSEDTLIFRARDYFEERSVKNPAQAALACFYSGCVYREQADYKQAMQEYKQAYNYALQATDSLLLGLIYHNMGDLLEEEDLHAEALEEYRKAKEIYSSFPKNQIHSLYAMGIMHLLLDNCDSALIYTHKALLLAEALEDEKMQSLLAHGLSVSYKEADDLHNAEYFLRKAFMLNTDSIELPRYYLNFANLYSAMGCEDSIVLYTERLKLTIDSVTDNYLKASVFGFLARREKERGNYDEAFYYQNEHSRVVEKIMEEQLRQSVYEVQQRYNFEKIKNEQQVQKNRYQSWIILLLVVILLSGTVFTFYTIRQKNLLLETRENIDTLNKMAKSLSKSYESRIQRKEKDLREALLWRFDVVKKAALLSESEVESSNSNKLLKKFHKIVYAENANDQWLGILSAFDQINKDVAENIKQKYTDLSEMEYKIVLLAYAGISVKETALILCLSSNTVQSYRSSLRKKIGINDSNSDMVLYLKDILKT